jgi:hypothetical protein
MTLPTLAKTWQIVPSVLVGGSATQETNCDELWLAIIDALTSVADGAWTVWGSSDGIAASNGDGANRWTIVTDLDHNTAGNAHSWIVIESATGVQVCIDLNYASSSPADATIVASFGGFSEDGTTTARPTATDEVTIESSQMWPTGSGYTYRVHTMVSTDGEETRVLLSRNGTVYWALMAGVAANRPPLLVWDGRWVVSRGDASTAQATYAVFRSAAPTRGVIDGAACTFYFSGEGTAGSSLGETMTVADEDTGEWPIGAIGLYCPTVGHRGRKGAVVDTWWGSTALNDGDTYPSDVSRAMIQLGDFILPWDGSIPEVT